MWLTSQSQRDIEPLLFPGKWKKRTLRTQYTMARFTQGMNSMKYVLHNDLEGGLYASNLSNASHRIHRRDRNLRVRSLRRQQLRLCVIAHLLQLRDMLCTKIAPYPIAFFSSRYDVTVWCLETIRSCCFRGRTCKRGSAGLQALFRAMASRRLVMTVIDMKYA